MPSGVTRATRTDTARSVAARRGVVVGQSARSRMDGETTGLARLREIASEQNRLDAERTEAVLQARAEGATWREIGATFSVTAEAARRRYWKQAWGIGGSTPLATKASSPGSHYAGSD